MHELVTNDWFVLITGLSGVAGLLISLFIAGKIIKIQDSNNIKEQNQTNIGSGKQAGRDVH
jgi:hypothetical protein